MLFDLRGGGRRRTIQAIYLSLAILMGGGLVLFGIGGNTSGGLVDAFNSGGGDVNETFEKRVERLEERVQQNPQDARAFAELARARYQLASSGEFYDQSTSSFTREGKQQLREVAAAWRRHLALAGANPNADVANLMVQVFGPGGLNQLDKAVAAMEIVIEDRPKEYGLYAQLAQLAYLAGQSRKGDLASARAVELAPEAQRPALRQQLKQLKTQATAQALQQQGAQGAPPAPAPAP